MIFCGWQLRDPSDLAILLDAVNASCEYLLTSDSRHFGEFFGHSTCGVTVLPPGSFLHRFGYPHAK